MAPAAALAAICAVTKWARAQPLTLHTARCSLPSYAELTAGWSCAVSKKEQGWGGRVGGQKLPGAALC